MHFNTIKQIQHRSYPVRSSRYAFVSLKQSGFPSFGQNLLDLNSDETGKLILFIIEEVNNAFEGGYLYVDEFQADDYFESEEFCDFVTGFSRKLEFDEKIEFLDGLDESLNYMEYSTFEQIGLDFSVYFQENEKKILCEFLLKIPSGFLSHIYRDFIREYQTVRCGTPKSIFFILNFLFSCAKI